MHAEHEHVSPLSDDVDEVDDSGVLGELGEFEESEESDGSEESDDLAEFTERVAALSRIVFVSSLAAVNTYRVLSLLVSIRLISETETSVS